jgi:hypothetical protein
MEDNMGKKNYSSPRKTTSVTLGSERTLKYVTNKPKFSCPVSPYIMWHYGLIYKECPLASEQRDMGVCDKCHLKGDSTTKGKKKRKRSYSKSKTKIEKIRKEPIPNVGKIYISE